VSFQRKRAGGGSPEGDSSPARPLSPERLERRARNVLLYQLNRSIKSKRQLADILVKREIPDEIALPLLDRFEEAGLINDNTFAEAVVSSRTKTRGLSRTAIQRELRQKGVAEEIVQEATAELDSESDLERATQITERRMRSMLLLAPEVRTRRLAAFLQRKGYSSAIVFKAIKLAETQAVKSEF
jgi:regulatory protein